MKKYAEYKKRAGAAVLTAICCVGACAALYGGVRTERISGLLEEKSVEDLAAESEVVVRGTITEVSKPYRIQSAAGTVSIFSDYTIAPEQVLRAPADAPEYFTLRMQGGQIGKNRTIVEENPALRQGDSGVFFLYRPHRGGGYNTPGDDYYYLSGMEQGAFLETEDGSGFCTEEGEALRLGTLPAQLAAQADVKPVWETDLENLQYNLREGFISQEEYDLFQAQMERYAQILPG